MASFDVATLLAELQVELDALTSANSIDDVHMLTTAIRNLSIDGISNTVATSSDLPTNSAVGTVYFVIDLGIPVVSDGTGQWFGLDGRDVNNIFEAMTVGRNASGALGINSLTPTSRETLGSISGSLEWESINQGQRFCVGITRLGRLWLWGENQYGQLGDNAITDRSSPEQIIGGGSNWSSCSAGGNHAMATKTDGTLWTWGYNLQGQLGDNTATSRRSPVTTAGGGTNWDKVAAGPNHSLATKTDGTLWTWGFNDSGRLGDNSTTNRSSPVTTAGGGTTWNNIAGSYHSIATKTDGTLWTWGPGNAGGLGDNTTTAKSSPVTTAGGGTTWDKVGCGQYFSIATKTDGTLWTWGWNPSGQLGDGTTTSRSSPGTTAGGGTNWDKISGGGNISSSYAIKTDGTLWSWGDNLYGKLANNAAPTDTSSPQTVFGGGTNWYSVSADFENMIALQNRRST